jgi:hypothetical protein
MVGQPIAPDGAIGRSVASAEGKPQPPRPAPYDFGDAFVRTAPPQPESVQRTSHAYRRDDQPVCRMRPSPDSPNPLESGCGSDGELSEGGDPDILGAARSIGDGSVPNDGTQQPGQLLSDFLREQPGIRQPRVVVPAIDSLIKNDDEVATAELVEAHALDLMAEVLLVVLWKRAMPPMAEVTGPAKAAPPCRTYTPFSSAWASRGLVVNGRDAYE